MKKRVIRLVAMLLCVMSFASLLPSAVLAADTDTDNVKAVVVNAAQGVRQAADARRNASVAEKYTYNLTVSRNSRVNLVDFNYYRHGTSAYPFAVSFYWYYMKPGTSKWVRLKKATKYMLSFAAKGKNGYVYRLKTTKKGSPSKVMLSITWKLKVT